MQRSLGACAQRAGCVCAFVFQSLVPLPIIFNNSMSAFAADDTSFVDAAACGDISGVEEVNPHPLAPRQKRNMIKIYIKQRSPPPPDLQSNLIYLSLIKPIIHPPTHPPTQTNPHYPPPPPKPHPQNPPSTSPTPPSPPLS